jgi:hypothetical protein
MVLNLAETVQPSVLESERGLSGKNLPVIRLRLISMLDFALFAAHF